MRVEAKNPFNPQTFVLDKHSVLDVRETDENGKIFAIEFQTAPHISFANRILYYWSRTYSTQLGEGERYRELCPVISIALVGFLLFEELEKLHNVFHITAEDAPEYILTEDFQLHSLELVAPKISQLPLLKEPLRCWLTFFYYADKKTEAQMKVLLKKDVSVEHAYDKYKRFCQDERLRAVDEAHQRYLHDYNSDVDGAMEKGLAQGRDEGVLEGRILTLLSFLQRRFGKLPKKLMERIGQLTDQEQIEELTFYVPNCRTLKEFAERF